jgi:hypothetical protein
MMMMMLLYLASEPMETTISQQLAAASILKFQCDMAG